MATATIAAISWTYWSVRRPACKASIHSASTCAFLSLSLSLSPSRSLSLSCSHWAPFKRPLLFTVKLFSPRTSVKLPLSLYGFFKNRTYSPVFRRQLWRCLFNKLPLKKRDRLIASEGFYFPSFRRVSASSSFISKTKHLAIFCRKSKGFFHRTWLVCFNSIPNHTTWSCICIMSVKTHCSPPATLKYGD